MKLFADRSFAIAGRLACCLLMLQVCCVGEAQAQTVRAGVGSLHSSGDVNINGLRASEEQTVLPGDTVRTGRDGAVVLTVPGVGMLSAGADTEIAFGTDQYFATLKQGTLAIRSLQGAGNLDIRFGNFLLYLPASGTEAVAMLSVGPDGARVDCRSGMVGVTAVQGASAVVLNAGESAIVTPAGELQKVAAGPVPTVAPGSTAHSGKKSRTGYVILGAAGAGGGIAAAVVLLHKSQPVSPAQP